MLPGTETPPPTLSYMSAGDEEVLHIIRSSGSNQEPAPPHLTNESWATFASFGPRCTRCGNPCGDDVVYHGSLAFHRRHFSCKRCGCALRIPMSINGDIYCQQCAKHIQPQSHCCAVCHAPRTASSIIAASQCFCPDHFRCSTCGCKLDNETYRQRAGKFYCLEHIPRPPQQFTCAVCNREIPDRRIVAFGKTFHPDCFCCTMCHQNLANQKYTGIDNKPLCLKCFKHLPRQVQISIANNYRP